MTHFLTIPFTGLGLFQGYRGDTWLTNRIAIFKQFVLPSILGQTNRDFWLWIQFRPEEESNPIVQNFINGLNSIRGLRVIVTYHGITMWDDKYSDEIARKRLMHSLEKSLPELEKIVDGDVLDTIQPSDDIYLTDAVDKLQELGKTHEGAFGWRKGYIMRYDNLDIAEYNPKTIPPFFTIKYPRETFLSPEKHFNFAPFKSHEYISDHLNYTEVSSERGYIVGTHGENTSTSFALAGRKVNNEKILIKAGLFNVEPLTVTKDKKRIWTKKILNLFPSSWQRAYIEKLSPGVKEAIRSYTYFKI